MTIQSKRKKTNTIWYRLCRYPGAAALSAGMVLILASVFCYLLGFLYPQFRLFERIADQLGIQKQQQYVFYSGQTTGAYYKIGSAINGKFGKKKSITNISTSGGSENGMKLTIENNAFGLIQEELINHDDQLRNNVKVITPLLLERMHILYRADLFDQGSAPVQVSASSDSAVLQRIRDSVVNVNMGQVGTGTRIVASYMMAILEQQMSAKLKSKSIKFNYLNESFEESAKKMKAYNGHKDSSVVDMLFYLVADPIDYIKGLLDTRRYRLMSIDPSLVVLMNKEFDLNLRVTDFKSKYDSAYTANTSTFGTLTLLIASKSVNEKVARDLVKKINEQRNAIHDAMIQDYKGDSTVLALNEFGFYNVLKDELEARTKTTMKEVLIFLLSVVTFFFPVFKSVIGVRQVWQRWSINKKIDEIIDDYGETPEEHSVALIALKELKEKVTDLYGEGFLTETRYKAFINRIEMYDEKFNANLVFSAKKTKQMLVKALRKFPLGQQNPS